MTPTPPPGRRRPARRMLGALAVALPLLGLIELGARLSWRLHLGLGVFDASHDADAFYKDLPLVRRVAPSGRDTIIDLLLLGGSTLHNDYGAIQALLLERLTSMTRRRVRVFNLGMPAHTSRDSYFKYRALAGLGFDLVILYDGVNEVRANNVPPALFRDDYSHYAWYQLVNDVLDRHRLRPLATPYTLLHLSRELAERRAARTGHRRTVPPDDLGSIWTEYGGAIRTAAPFRHNVEATLDLAAARGDPAIVMTYAYYLAPGYTAAAFRDRQLDYARHRSPIALWGRPANVTAGIDAHNTVIRGIHAARPDVGFVDMAAAIPHSRVFFDDACHLTIAGSARFVDALLPVIFAQLDTTLTHVTRPPSGAPRPPAPAARHRAA